MVIKNKQTSFTLIELLVVIVIIGILAGVIMISTSSSIAKANIAKLKVFEESVTNNLAANMVSRWKLDEGANTAANDTWGSNSGTLNNFANPSTSTSGWIINENDCISNKCLRFDGLDDYINCGNGNTLNPDKNITISIWIKKANESAVQMPIVSRWGPAAGDLSYMIDIYQNQIRWTVRQTTEVQRIRYSTTIMKQDTWYFLVSKFDGDEPYLYVNGVEEGTLSGNKVTYLLQSSTGLNLIGKKSDSGTVYFNGIIDDVKIYNAALSSSQIKQNYIAGLDSLLSKNLISKEEHSERISELVNK